MYLRAFQGPRENAVTLLCRHGDDYCLLARSNASAPCNMHGTTRSGAESHAKISFYRSVVCKNKYSFTQNGNAIQRPLPDVLLARNFGSALTPLPSLCSLPGTFIALRGYEL